MSKIFPPASILFLVLVARLYGADPIPATVEAAPSPTPASNLAPLPNPSDLPTSQESTEQSVLPSEPVLALPDQSVLPDAATLKQVQALPTEKNITFESKLLNDAKDKVTVRKAKTSTALQPEMEDLKARAFAAKTEREKRELLRQYYKARQETMLKEHPDVTADINNWATIRLYLVSRPRTEPNGENVDMPKNLHIKKPRLDDQ